MPRRDSAITRPDYLRATIDSFADVLAQVMFGNYQVRAVSARDDEFADLAMYINTMIAALERGAAQEERRKQDLEALVAARTAELIRAKRQVEAKAGELKSTTAQLVQTEKLRALGEMSAGVAHEMNQPLNAIRLICQDMLRDVERERLDVDAVGPNLREVIEMVDKMAAIVDEMRLFSRRTTEQPRSAAADANEAVDGVFRLLGQQLQDRGIEAVRSLDRAAPPVLADPIRLEQVIMNLLTNARDAVESHRKRGGRIEVKSYARNDDPKLGRVVVVEVSDNGPGLSAKAKERAFEPFFTTKPEGEGTGLGLSISRQLIQDMGGRIELAGEEGQGAVFRLVLVAAK